MLTASPTHDAPRVDSSCCRVILQRLDECQRCALQVERHHLPELSIEPLRIHLGALLSIPLVEVFLRDALTSHSPLCPLQQCDEVRLLLQEPLDRETSNRRRSRGCQRTSSRLEGSPLCHRQLLSPPGLRVDRRLSSLLLVDRDRLRCHLVRPRRLVLRSHLQRIEPRNKVVDWIQRGPHRLCHRLRLSQSAFCIGQPLLHRPSSCCSAATAASMSHCEAQIRIEVR